MPGSGPYAHSKTQLQASTDSLTGLVNRRSFETQVRGLINQKRLFALAVADLDHFKTINDTHGHDAGDRALMLFSQFAHDLLRDGDILARWGGEEFVFVFPDLDRHQAVRVLDRLREGLAEAQPGTTPRFTASFGVTDTDAAESLEQLLHIADSGLYVSKNAGRDQVTIGELNPDAPLRPPRQRKETAPPYHSRPGAVHAPRSTTQPTKKTPARPGSRSANTTTRPNRASNKRRTTTGSGSSAHQPN